MTRRQEILATAGDMFRRHGYHATSIRDIAKRLNLRGSSLYAHIASKEELLWELVDRASQAFLASARAVPDGLPPEERLVALIEGHLAVIARELPNATAFFHEWTYLSEELRSQVVERRDAYETRFREAIEAGVADGSFRVPDVRIATLFVLSALNWSYHWLRPDGPLDLATLSERYTALILGALRCGAAVPPPNPNPDPPR